MSGKLCVFTWGAILLLSAWLDNMQAPETAWAQPTYGFQGSRPLLPAGEVFRDCPRCPEMVVLPAGIFMMGRVDMRSGFHPVTGLHWIPSGAGHDGAEESRPHSLGVMAMGGLGI